MYFKSFLYLSLIFLFVHTSYAQTNTRQLVDQTHGWYVYSGNHRLNERWSLHTEYQWRRDGFIQNWQQSLLRLGVDYHLRPDVTFTAGYAWIVTFPYGAQPIATTVNEDQLWEQVLLKQTLGRVRVSHRFRNEMRWIGHYDPLPNGDFERNGQTYANRFRYRVGVEVPLNRPKFEQGTLFVGCSNELFVNYGRHTLLNRFDQNWFTTTLGYQFSNKGNVQLGYLQQLQVKGDGIHEERNHTLLLSVNYSLDFRRNK
jgi:hypothetical protein